MFGYFWWTSAMARMDTRDSLAGIRELGVGGRFRRVAPPEEVTTFNLVRRLAHWHARRGGTVVALHSRPLEGGRVGIRAPSGADLQMAVEVAPGQWLDLMLQAKRLDPTTGRYLEWNSTQLHNLRLWAASHGGRTPGVLLYNSPTPPFGPPGTVTTQGACCSSPIRCHGWHWPTWSLPDNRSPLAVTLVPLPAGSASLPSGHLASATAPSADAVNQAAMPLECVFCPSGPLVVERRGATPGWALPLLEKATEADPEYRQSVDDEPADVEDPSAPTFSIGLDYVDDEDPSFRDQSGAY